MKSNNLQISGTCFFLTILRPQGQLLISRWFTAPFSFPFTVIENDGFRDPNRPFGLEGFYP